MTKRVTWTKERFEAWIDQNIDKNPLKPYNNWLLEKAYHILREDPIDEEKVDTFVKMIRFDFARSLYLFMITYFV